LSALQVAETEQQPAAPALALLYLLLDASELRDQCLLALFQALQHFGNLGELLAG
jgi:hypothetical protein